MIEKPYSLKIKNATTGTVRGSRFVTLHEALFVALQEIQQFMEKKEPGGVTIYRDIFTDPIYAFTTRNGEQELRHSDTILLTIMIQEIEFYTEIFEKHKEMCILDTLNEIMDQKEKSKLN